MKARQDFTIYVDKVGTPTSHYSGDSLKDKKKIVVKKGDEVPKDLHSYFLQLHSDWIDLSSVTEDERTKAIQVSKEKPVKKKKKKLTKKEVNYLTKKEQTAYLKELGYTGKIPKRESSVISLIMKLQEK